MRLRTSSFVHLLPVGEGRSLVLHAVSHLRLTVDPDIAWIVEHFRQPRTLPQDYLPLAARLPQQPVEAVLQTLQALVERGVLTEDEPDAEAAKLSAELSAHHGRDPAALVEQFRRKAQEGGHSYWAAGAAQGLADLGGERARLSLILLGDCDVHMESDFLRREAAGRGVDLRVAAAFPDDADFAREHAHDAILIGALRGRHAIAETPPDGQAPYAAYIGEAERLIRALRERTAAAILIDNLPEPTVEPLGLAERGLLGHRTRFRLANAALAQLAEDFADVHVVDLAAALAAVGAERLVDDGQVGFTHFGSPGWMLQRAPAELAAVHDQFPDMAPLAAAVGGDPYAREAVAARAHVDALVAALGVGRKKCVILDLDGVLWPGVLAETGAPLAWSAEISGPFSYVGLYFGLHEALLCLKRRGVLLACVSKNDEAVVRQLWRWPEHYPRERLLTPDDFVTWRVNWDDKGGNIASIAQELGFDLSAFLFIDDHPVERDRVRQRLPAVEVWGEDPFALRRRLLTDPRLQVPRLTAETVTRTDLVKAQLYRQQARAVAVSEEEHMASLQVRCEIQRLGAADTLALQRVEELFQRTTQFNATGRKFPAGGLAALATGPDPRDGTGVFCVRVADRFGDHGLAGAAVIEAGEIIGLAVSCRVLGLGADRALLAAVRAGLVDEVAALSGRITPTERNGPVRNVYRDAGFAMADDGVWRAALR